MPHWLYLQKDRELKYYEIDSKNQIEFLKLGQENEITEAPEDNSLEIRKVEIAQKKQSLEERKAALILSKSVALGKKMVADGETSAAVVKEAMIKKIESEPMAKIDYVEAVDGLSMQPVEEIKAPVLVAMAVYIGKTRLIDNFTVE